MGTFEAVDLVVFNFGEGELEFGECCHCGEEIIPAFAIDGPHRKYVYDYPFFCTKCGKYLKVIARAEDVQ